VFLQVSVLNFLLLKKYKGFTNYDEIHNFERKLNLRHTTLENKLHNRALDCSIKLKREELLYIRTIFNFQAECVLIYMLFFYQISAWVFLIHMFLYAGFYCIARALIRFRRYSLYSEKFQTSWGTLLRWPRRDIRLLNDNIAISLKLCYISLKNIGVFCINITVLYRSDRSFLKNVRSLGRMPRASYVEI